LADGGRPDFRGSPRRHLGIAPVINALRLDD
jgi:hypothetical protein